MVRNNGRERDINEQEAVFAHCQERQKVGQEISHAVARTIGSWWHDGRVTATMQFSSTGYIAENLTPYTFHEGTYSEQTEGDRLALDMLGTYLLDRRKRGETDMVPGWSNMWAVK